MARAGALCPERVTSTGEVLPAAPAIRRCPYHKSVWGWLTEWAEKLAGLASGSTYHKRGVAIRTIASVSTNIANPSIALRLLPWRGGASCFPPDASLALSA
jgi:hypothetical protein